MKLILIMLGMAQILVMPALSVTNIKPLAPDAGLYFHNYGTVNLLAVRWKIIVNYDLTGYWEDIRSLEQHIRRLNETCQGGSKENVNLKLCDVIIQQLDEQWQEIRSQNALIATTNREHVINKRDIGNTVGYIMGDAFGIMTHRDAVHIESQLDRAKTNEAYLLQLIKNQTSIVDATKNIFKHQRELNENQFRTIAQHFLHIEGKIIQLSADSTQNNKLQSMTTFTIYIMLIMRRLAEKQRVIIDVILNSHQGHIHPALLTPQQLKAEIQRIENYIPATITVPDGDDDHSLGHIYDILTVQTRVTSRYILFRVQLPLTYTEVYQLFSIIPIPRIDGDYLRIIQPTTEQLIIDLHREHYAPLISRDLQRCILLKNHLYICDISPIYSTKSNQNQCEINLLTNVDQGDHHCTTRMINQASYWTQLDTNQWIFGVSKPKIVNLVCSRQVSTLNLSGSGILTLDPTCMLGDGEFRLAAVEERSRTINSSVVASVKLQYNWQPNQQLTNVTGRPKMIRNESLDRNIAAIDKAIELQRINEVELPAVIESSSDGHHIHHYVVIYTLVTIAIILGLVYMCRRGARQPPAEEGCHQPEPVSLESLRR